MAIVLVMALLILINVGASATDGTSLASPSSSSNAGNQMGATAKDLTSAGQPHAVTNRAAEVSEGQENNPTVALPPPPPPADDCENILSGDDDVNEDDEGQENNPTVALPPPPPPADNYCTFAENPAPPTSSVKPVSVLMAMLLLFISLCRCWNWFIGFLQQLGQRSLQHCCLILNRVVNAAGGVTIRLFEFRIQPFVLSASMQINVRREVQ